MLRLVAANATYTTADGSQSITFFRAAFQGLAPIVARALSLVHPRAAASTSITPRPSDITTAAAPSARAVDRWSRRRRIPKHEGQAIRDGKGHAVAAVEHVAVVASGRSTGQADRGAALVDVLVHGVIGKVVGDAVLVAAPAGLIGGVRHGEEVRGRRASAATGRGSRLCVPPLASTAHEIGRPTLIPTGPWSI